MVRHTRRTATRDAPFVITHEGRTFRLWPEAAPQAQRGPEATETAQWTIDVDGEQTRGWEADANEGREDVRKRLLSWWEEMKDVGGSFQ
jgi:hypothetical protein